MRKICIFLISLTTGCTLQAQINATNYPFTATTGVALEDMSSGTIQLLGSNIDNDPSLVFDIGFDFWFDGTHFTSFSVNPNGLFRLGSSVITNDLNNSLGFASTSNTPKMAPYFDNLRIGSNGKVHYKVMGNQPLRRFVVEWKNMQIPLGSFGNEGDGTFQLSLHESTGAIKFVYGNGMIVNNANGGYSIGIQSGSGSNLASILSMTGTVSYGSSNNTQTNAIAPGTCYSFNPVAPAAPGNLSFTNTGKVNMTLNWLDNAADETAYVIYGKDDPNPNGEWKLYIVDNSNTTSSMQTGLDPGTLHSWRIHTVGKGALSAPLEGSESTLPSELINSNTSGDWNIPTTWELMNLPEPGDIVKINTGHSVTLNQDASVERLEVDGALGFNEFFAQVFSAKDVQINTGGSITAAPTGTITTNNFTIRGDLVNNGMLDLSRNGNASRVDLNFTGKRDQSFTGSGMSNLARVFIAFHDELNSLEMAPDNLTIRGSSNDMTGFLQLQKGIFKIGGNFSLSSPVFMTNSYVINPDEGIWLNNPNFTVTGLPGGVFCQNNGLLRITEGTYNIGVGAADGMGGGMNARFIIEGGTLNSTGRIDPQGIVNYTQTGGTVNVATVGNVRPNFGSFEIDHSQSFVRHINGTINVNREAVNSNPVDYRVNGDLDGVIGVILRLGVGTGTANSTYQVSGNLPIVEIGETGKPQNVSLIGDMDVLGPMTILEGSTFDINGSVLKIISTPLTNNGTLDGSTSTSRLIFAGTGLQQYSGTGIVPDLFQLEVDNSGGVQLNGNLQANRAIFWKGGLYNSELFTLGGIGNTHIQIGDPFIPTNAFGFDEAPIYAGTDYYLDYLKTTSGITTGYEIPPSRILKGLTFINDDPATPLTIDGGDIMLSGFTSIFKLFEGRIITGQNTINLQNDVFIDRINGYVDGKLSIRYNAPGSQIFDVGTENGYSPVEVNLKPGTVFPIKITVIPDEEFHPSFNPSRALHRNWLLTADQPLIADLGFVYHQSDVAGNEMNYSIYRIPLAGSPVAVPGTIYHAQNIFEVMNITGFSHWTLAEASAILPVNLISFNGNHEGGKNILKWITTDEQNNKGFSIERSVDGRMFANIGFVDGTNSTGHSSYEFTDHDLQGDRWFYRLRQTDLDGRFTLSPVIQIRKNLPATVSLLELFPNPAKQELNLRIESPVNQKLQIRITDIRGRMIKNISMDAAKGFNSFQIDLDKWEAGLYFLQLEGADKVLRFIKE